MPVPSHMMLLTGDAGGMVRPPIRRTGTFTHLSHAHRGKSLVATYSGTGAKIPARKNQLRLLYTPCGPNVRSGPMRPQITEAVKCTLSPGHVQGLPGGSRAVLQMFGMDISIHHDAIKLVMAESVEPNT